MKATVLVKHPGLLIPKDYLQKVLQEASPICLGIACFKKDTDGLLLNHWPALQEVGSTMEEIADAIMELQEDIKEGTALIALSDVAGQVLTVDGEYDTPDMQPYPVMTDGEGGVHLVATVLGDFSAFAQKERPGETFAVIDDLAPRMMDIFSAQGEDLTKMMTYVRGSQVAQKDLKKLSNGDTGIITLFSSDGDILTLNKRETDLIQTDWGWTTHVSPKAVEQPKEEQKKSKFSLNFRKPAPTPAPVADATKAEPVVADATKTDTKSAEPATLVNRIKCPSHITGKNNISEWYMKNAGFVPNNYKQKPMVDVVEKLKDLKNLKEAMIQNGSATAEPKPKDTEPHSVKSEHAKPVESKVPGLIPAAQKEKMMKDSIILKMVDRSSQVIKNREKIMAEEDKTSSFPEQLPKIGLEGLWGALEADYDHLILEYPDAVKSALMAYRSLHLKVEDMKRANNKNEETGPEATPTTTKQEAEPAPSPAPVRKLTLSRKVA